MKIGMIVTSFPVAAQPFILNQVIGLLDQGGDVEVIARNDTRHEAYHADFDDYALAERTTYLWQPEGMLARLWFCWQHRRHWSAMGRRLGASLNVFKYGRDALSLRLLVFLVQLHDRHWDIVHVQYGVNGYIGRFLRDVGIARKFILQIRGSVFATTERRHRCRAVLSNADQVLTISQALWDLVVAKGADPERCRVLYTGLRIDRFPFNEDWRLDLHPLKLLAVGRLVPVKGHHLLVEALGLLVEAGMDVTCTIVGGGPLRNALLAAAELRGVADRLTLIDLIPQEALIHLYHSHHALVHPSIVLPNGCFEGMGTAITEAQACGLPVMASDHGGMLDTVKDGETGFLFATGDAEALAARVQWMAEHAEILNSMRFKARKQVEQEHDCVKQERVLMQVFQEREAKS